MWQESNGKLSSFLCPLRFPFPPLVTSAQAGDDGKEEGSTIRKGETEREKETDQDGRLQAPPKKNIINKGLHQSEIPDPSPFPSQSHFIPPRLYIIQSSTLELFHTVDIHSLSFTRFTPPITKHR